MHDMTCTFLVTYFAVHIIVIYLLNINNRFITKQPTLYITTVQYLFGLKRHKNEHYNQEKSRKDWQTLS